MSKTGVENGNKGDKVSKKAEEHNDGQNIFIFIHAFFFIDHCLKK